MRSAQQIPTEKAKGMQASVSSSSEKLNLFRNENENVFIEEQDWHHKFQEKETDTLVHRLAQDRIN